MERASKNIIEAVIDGDVTISMEAIEKLKPIHGRYVPCLKDCHKDITLVVPIPPSRPHDPIMVELNIPQALAIMGDRVHILLDEENKRIYIRGHMPDIDDQAPLWHATYSDECISYAYDGHLGEENNEHVNVIAKFIDRLYPAGTYYTQRHRLKGLYSYDYKTLIFYVDLNDYHKAKSAF